MENEDVEYLKNLVKERLASMPPDVSFSIGDFGDFTRDQLIDEVDKYSDVGKETINMQLNFIKKMPKIFASNMSRTTRQ